jgi:hypothetical protein
MTADPQPGPLIVGGVVVLHDQWLELVSEALNFQAGHLWREARLRPSRRQQELLDAVRDAMSATNVTIPVSTGDDAYMGTTELADTLACSVRHARRLADRLDPRFDGRLQARASPRCHRAPERP